MTAFLKKCLLSRGWLFGLGVFLFLPQLFALDPSRAVFQYNFQSWTRQNGLPFNKIRAITQTADGHLWMGTQNGMVRFDGNDFLHVTLPPEIGWRSQAIHTLAPSARGGLWFGLEIGAFGYYDGKSRFEAFHESWVVPQMNVHSVKEALDGSVWIASRMGIASLSGKKTNESKTNTIFLDAGLPEGQTIYQDARQRLWFGTVLKGLFFWEHGKLNAFPDPDLVGYNIRSISMDHAGQLWVGTQGGLRVYDAQFRLNEKISLPIEIETLLVDQHGAMWIGTTGEGLARYFNGEFAWLKKANGLAQDYVSALYEDHEGSLWVGTRDGLTQICDLKFPAPATKNGLLGEPVHGVSAARNGGVWCATARGIYNYHNQSVNDLQISELSGSVSNPYYAKRVLEARDGTVYTLMGNRDIQVISQGKVVKQYSNNDWPVACAEDAEGVIVSVGSRLNRVSRTEMKPYVFKGTSPSFYWIRDLLVRKDGSLLVASVNGMFHIRDGKVEHHWALEEGLAERDVACLCEDPDGTIWVGQVTGLARIKQNQVTVIHNELMNVPINALVSDDFGNLWLSCPKGVIRASRQSLNDFAEGKTREIQSRLYDGIDSLRTIDVSDVECVACKSADGLIWFPGQMGAIQIDPAHIPMNPVPPPVILQKVVINGVEYPNATPGKISAGRGELAFQYAALSFIAPQRLRFRYKLEGYDADWIEAGSQRSALYANLKPRKYTFRVQACNVDGIWNTQGASCEIELPPFYYQTAWFQALSALGIVLGLFGIYAWRLGHLRHKEQNLQAANELLETKIRERTQEVADQRNLLRTLIDNLPDEVFVKDIQGRVIIDNLAHARALGVQDPADAVGKTDFDCLPPEKAEQFRRSELVLLNSGKEYNGEENIILKNGESRWLRTTKVPLRDNQGEIIGLAGIHRDITERKKWEAELELLHKQLLESSRQAGMAEVATSVLHNVGNVLNSVNVSASILGEAVRNSPLDRLNKVLEMLREHRADLAQFLTRDDKGTKLLSYLDALFNAMVKEKNRAQEEVKSLVDNVEHIKKIVSMQQSYARVSGLVEMIKPSELAEDALRMHEAAYQRHTIEIIRDYSEVPPILVDRHKVIQILVNLLQNAKYACDANTGGNRQVRVRIYPVGAERIRIEVIDNGMGIPAENLTRIFSYGFTTRKNGHGFGLHSGALAAKEMGGSLTVISEGAGKGSAFILELPVENKSTRPATEAKTDSEISADSENKSETLIAATHS